MSLQHNEIDLTGIGDKIIGSGDRQCTPKTAKSGIHARPPSATGVRSKIPTNVHRNALPTADSHGALEPSSDSQKDSARRLKSKSFNASIKKAPCAPSGMQRRTLENQLHVKKNKYATLKKELVEKQKSAIEMYEDVLQLREKLIAIGGNDPGKIDAIQLLCDKNLHSSGGGETKFTVDSTVTKEFVSNIQVQFEDLSKNLYEVCKDGLSKYSKVLKRLMSDNQERKDNEPEIMLELKEYEVDRDNLMIRLEAAKKVDDDFRNGVMEKISILWSEIETCRIRIKHLENSGDEVVNQLKGKFNSEVEKLRVMTERKASVDGQLQKAKLRIKELEGKVEEEESKITQLQGTIKNLEGQLKQKESSFEQRTREMQKSLKNAEANKNAEVAKLESQRNNLETRLSELKKGTPRDHDSESEQRLKRIDEEQMESIQNELEMMRSKVTEQEEKIKKLEQDKLEVEAKFRGELNEKIREFEELQRKHEALEIEKESIQCKLKDIENASPKVPSPTSHHCRHGNNQETGNTIYGSLEALKLNDDLRTNINELKRRIKELEAELNQRNIQLQQQERIVREQMNQLKLRDGMISSLKIKNNPNKSGKEVIGKASLEELYSTLESKEKQIAYLEKTVDQMQDHDMHAQEQRTRLEKRIAQLELNLQNKKTEKGYVLRDEIEKSTITNYNSRNVPTVPPSKINNTTNRKTIDTYRRDKKMQRSKTLSSFMPSNKFADGEAHDYHKILNANENYHDCINPECGFESFYKWLMKDPSRRHSKLPRSSRYNREIDVRYYHNNQDRNQCGRESDGFNKHSDFYVSSSKLMKNRRTLSKDSGKRY